jgi:hypothetical protein
VSERPPPALSVVIAASDSAEAVARTVASLVDPCGSAGRVEIIVAAALDRIEPRAVPPGVRWVAAPEGTGVPRLRRLGLDHASAPLVAWTEDSCVLAPGWSAGWRAAFDDPRVQAATGPVEPAPGDAPRDWAVFFCEYAPFLRRGPGSESPTPAVRLAGNNFAARRSEVEGLGRDDIHESDVARGLATLVLADAAEVRHVRRYTWREAISDRLRFGASYGRLRARDLPSALRGAGLLAGPAILLVQVARLGALMLARRRHLGRFVECLPITLALVTAWSVGEWLGWIGAVLHPPVACRRRETGVRRRARPPGRRGSPPARCRPVRPPA